MAKKVKKVYPSYFEEFKCIGGECSDSCCIGWNIDIDKITFRKYFKVQDQEMKKMFQKNIQNNERCSSEEVDYGIVKLKKDKRCPFLDEKNYCVIHSNLGEEYLSNVCTCFPRVTNKIDETYEMSLDVACPEAARLILLREEGINFIGKEEALGKHIISSQIDTKLKEIKKTPLKYFKEVREFCISIIQNRKFNLNERIYILGDFISNIEDVIDKDLSDIPKFINSYNMRRAAKEFINDDINSLLGNSNINYIIQMNFFIKMLKILKVDKEVESITFKNYTSDMINGFKIENEESISKNSEFYMEAFEEYNESFISQYSYIFENYIVNFIFNNTFPFNEVMSLFDSYMMLLIRVSFIRFYLVGMNLNNNNYNKENVVEFIQVFSKTIEHHKSYLIDSLHYIKRNDYDNMEFAKTLL
ncbi:MULTISPECIES: flagellin lysine-N-methylase [unclassified Clostridium]|uniref:flagellin lysine-N-methylase n=1 Tax=Clostridium TaxID=1485 RepID=UPI001C8BB092|nr:MULTISPECIES: flagellin lysine-N-methylase [unclassified Clostridium]MBX9136448.1 FliB family protein [Clostridium sp. K12(2020)]MBX9143071.1 FliB family protein [Clostridium sp. K13]MDU2289752.1 flagellin lysine-N-methylase [Clostridium celatum]MDU4325115.1 flagellin lysine-N-methylase [Clostridium celatum]